MQKPDFWILQTVGWLLFIWMSVTQAFSAVFWEQAVAWGLQEGADQVTQVGAAFLYGYAFADLVYYLPVLGLGLVGHALRRRWSATVLAAALGVTVYWPLASLAAVSKARTHPDWALANEAAYWIVLPPIALWAIWGLLRLALTTHISDETHKEPS